MSANTLTFIHRWLDENLESMFTDLAKMVETRSVFPDELPVQRDVIEPMMRAMDFDEVARVNLDEEADRPFVVGVRRGTGGGRSLLLNGHIDTVGVPGTMGERWTTDPWKAIVRDGRLYGHATSTCMILPPG